MINKKVLSEIALYKGEVKMPKFFDINRSELKADILNSFITSKTLSQDNLNYAVLDYQIPFSKSFDMLQKYVTEYFKLEQKLS
jgi:ribosomal protein S18